MATTQCAQHELRLWEKIQNGSYVKFVRCAVCGYEANASQEDRNDEQPLHPQYFGRHQDSVRD
jgi:Zn ribbon nucleic-acid-binding protein